MVPQRTISAPLPWCPDGQAAHFEPSIFSTITFDIGNPWMKVYLFVLFCSKEIRVMRGESLPCGWGTSHFRHKGIIDFKCRFLRTVLESAIAVVPEFLCGTAIFSPFLLTNSSFISVAMLRTPGFGPQIAPPWVRAAWWRWCSSVLGHVDYAARLSSEHLGLEMAASISLLSMPGQAGPEVYVREK